MTTTGISSKQKMSYVDVVVMKILPIYLSTKRSALTIQHILNRVRNWFMSMYKMNYIFFQSQCKVSSRLLCIKKWVTVCEHNCIGNSRIVSKYEELKIIMTSTTFITALALVILRLFIPMRALKHTSFLINRRRKKLKNVWSSKLISTAPH